MKRASGGCWEVFADRDETTAETGVREAMEESGWVVRNLRLLRINDNPRRPHEDRQNIDFIYTAEGVEKTGEKDWESEAIRWFPLDKLPPESQIAFDHIESIELYKKYLQAAFPLPVVGNT